MFELNELEIKAAATMLQHYCHGQAKYNGWWTDMLTGQDLTSTGYPKVSPTKNVGELIALAHSELSEALEHHRKLLMDDKLPHRNGLEVELADCLIRIFDMCGGLGLDVAGAISEKLLFNSQRSDHQIKNRLEVGGKRF